MSSAPKSWRWGSRRRRTPPRPLRPKSWRRFRKSTSAAATNGFTRPGILTGNALSEIDVVVVDASAGKIDVRLRVTSPTSGLVRVAAATFDEFWRKLPDASSPGAGAQDSWGVKANLKAGDSWNYSYDRPLFAGPASMRWIGHGEALGAEAVDLPDGQTAQTLKIEFFERPSVARYNLELHVVEWFAPDMNRYVRRDVETRWNGQVTDSTTDELQDYIRRR